MPSGRYGAMRAYQAARLVGARLTGRPNRWRGVRVLGYHRLAEVQESLSVPPARFRWQMETVLASGAEPVRLDGALDLLRAQVDGRYVCITFDDGYADCVEHGEPVLRELGIPATIFVPTGVLDGDATYFWYADPPPALTWDEVHAAAGRGVFDFQSHTRTHRWLPDLSDDEVRDEFVRSKAELERHIPHVVSTICYPGGLYGLREEHLLRESGYRAGVSTAPGVNRGGERSLRRTLVYGEDGTRSFEAKLAGLLDGTPLLRRVGYRRLGGFASAPRDGPGR